MCKSMVKVHKQNPQTQSKQGKYSARKIYKQNTHQQAKSKKEFKSLFLQYQQINVFQVGHKSCLSLLQFVITDQHPLVLVAGPRTVVGRAWRLSFVNNSSNRFILEGTNPDIISSESCYLPVIELLERLL